MTHIKYIPLFAFALISSLSLSSCSTIESEAKYPTGADRPLVNDDIYAEPESIFGAGGLSIFNNRGEDETTGIGVNSYLWRASLDTVSFMPLDSADPFGGVITTDWYQNPNTPGERLKVNVVILSKALKSDGLRVSVFQQKQSGAAWNDVAVSDQTVRELENAILTRARQLRVADL